SLQHEPALEVNAPRDRDQRRVARGNPEVVDVCAEVVGGSHGGDKTIRLVVDDERGNVLPAPRPPAPPGQDGSATVALDAKVGDSARVEWMEPDDLAAVVENQRAGLCDVFLRGDEDVAGRGPAVPLQDRDRGRLQIGTTDVVLVRRRRSTGGCSGLGHRGNDRGGEENNRRPASGRPHAASPPVSAVL